MTNAPSSAATGTTLDDSHAAHVAHRREAAHAPNAPHHKRVTRLHAVVTGRVQGVGYRYWAHHTARQIEGGGGGASAITGEVRNLPNGDVSVIAEADAREPLENLLTQLHTGPSSAHVETVSPMWEEAVAARYEGSELVVV